MLAGTIGMTAGRDIHLMNHDNGRKGTDGNQTVGGRHPLLTGIEGGLFATGVMTLFREPTARALPPTAEFLARCLGGEPADYPVTAFILHLLYGIGAGVVFVPVLTTLLDESDEPETVGLVAGAFYGLAASVFGERVVLRRMLEMELDTDEAEVFHAGHLIYGLALGVWIGSRSWFNHS